MSFKKILPVLAIGATVIAAIFGAVSYRNVSASAPVAQSAQAAQPAADLAAVNNGKGQRDGSSDQELATALGIDVTKLQAAYTTATAEALKQAVAAGLITQAQADQMTANGSGRFRGLPMVNSSSIDYDALLANALGISTDQLKAAYQKAYLAHIDAAVTAGTMTQAQADLAKGEYALKNNAKFNASIQSAYEAALKQAVTDGVITQAQADAILKNQASQPTKGMGGLGMRGADNLGGHAGGRGGARQPGTQNTNPNSPKVTPTPTN
jgi:hypothetical protein